MALNTGFPVLEIDNMVAMPVSRDRIDRRRKEIAALFSSPSLDLLKDLKVRWALFNCAELARYPAAVQTFVETLKSLPGVEDLSERGATSDCYLFLKIPGA